MSVQSQISRIKQDITNAYSAIRSMGVNVPTGQYLSSSQLANYILKIPKADTSLKLGGIITGLQSHTTGSGGHQYTFSTSVDDISFSEGYICGFIKDVAGGVHSIHIEYTGSTFSFRAYNFATGWGLRVHGKAIEFTTSQPIVTIYMWSSTNG